jgi:hypothetical protein
MERRNLQYAWAWAWIWATEQRQHFGYQVLLYELQFIIFVLILSSKVHLEELEKNLA